MTQRNRPFPFPAAQESFVSGRHRFASGGMSMEIKHTHPEYKTSQQREQAFRDAKQLYLKAISALMDTGKHRT